MSTLYVSKKKRRNNLFVLKQISTNFYIGKEGYKIRKIAEMLKHVKVQSSLSRALVLNAHSDEKKNTQARGIE